MRANIRKYLPRFIGGGGMIVLLIFTATACLDDDDMCGDEMVRVKGGMCTPRPEVSTADTDTGTADTASGTSASGPTGMGDACTSDANCTQEADYCAIDPTVSPEGICTVQGCSLNPDDCPTGYSCMDLSIFMAGLPTICTPSEDTGGLPTGMGDTCTSTANCTQEADYCAIDPTVSQEGICTVQGCSLNPDDCPTGYSCMDLSIFMAGLPTICTPEVGQ